MAKNIFIISSRKNLEINNKLCELLESRDHKVHIALRDTPQEPGELMYKTNTKAIQKADLIIANAVQSFPLTKNWAFEFGYAMALGKKIVCIGNIAEDADMIKIPLKEHYVVSSIEEFEKRIEELVK